MTTLSTILPATLLVAFASALPAAAAAAPVTVLAHAQAQAAALRAQAKKAGALDTTPPVLAQFALGGTVDVQQGASALATMTLTDDLSGIQFVTLTLTSPSGAQTVSLYNLLNSGARKYAGQFAVGSQDLTDFGGHFTRYSEPGTWTATSLFAFDVNGNAAIYDAAQLAALGDATVTVVNGGAGYDAIAPILTTGEIVTRKVTVSKAPPGTAAGTLPFIDAGLSVFDPGNGASSGAYLATMSFCLPDQWGNCKDWFELDGRADAPGQSLATVRLSGSPRTDQMPGKYILNQVYLQDIAGNGAVLSSDLAAHFPKGITVTVAP